MGGQFRTVVNNISCVSGFLPTGPKSFPTSDRPETPIPHRREVWSKPCHACCRFKNPERFCRCGRAAPAWNPKTRVLEF